MLSKVIWLAAVNREQDAQSLCQAEIKKILLTLWRKLPANVEPAENMEKSKKAEGNDLPAHPVGDHQDTLEKKRLGLITEIKKKKNSKTMTKLEEWKW